MKKVKIFLPIFILFLFWMVVIVWVNPVGEFPLNDDWIYAYPAYSVANGGLFQFGVKGIIQANTIGHSILGTLVCMITGFSFTALRCTNLAIAFIAVLIFYALLIKHTGKTSAFLGSFALMGCPLFFNMAFTFMTDVTFLCYVLAAFFAWKQHADTQKKYWICLFIVFSALAFSVRQMGIFLFPAAALAAYNADKRNFKEGLYYFLAGSLIYLLFEWGIKNWLQINEAYLQSEKTFVLTLIEQPKYFLKESLQKGVKILLNLGLYTLPFTLFIHQVLKAGLKKFRIVIVSLLIVSIAIVMALFLTDKSFPFGNVFYNLGLGPLLLTDASKGIYIGHQLLPSFIIRVLDFLAAYNGLLLFLWVFLKLKSYWARKQGFVMLLVSFSMMYLGSISVLNFFDRYLLVPFAVVLLLFSMEAKQEISVFTKTSIVVFLSFYATFAMAATKDYLDWNRARALAVQYTLKNKIYYDQLDAGYEWNGWLKQIGSQKQTTGFTWWNAENPEYLLSFGRAEGYTSIEKFPYCRRLHADHAYIHLQKRVIP